MPDKTARAHMEEKYAWAVRTGNTIQQQALLQSRLVPANLRGFTEIKEAFGPSPKPISKSGITTVPGPSR
jgi:hypothetical protein